MCLSVRQSGTATVPGSQVITGTVYVSISPPGMRFRIADSQPPAWSIAAGAEHDDQHTGSRTHGDLFVLELWGWTGRYIPVGRVVEPFKGYWLYTPTERNIVLP